MIQKTSKRRVPKSKFELDLEQGDSNFYEFELEAEIFCKPTFFQFFIKVKSLGSINICYNRLELGSIFFVIIIIYLNTLMVVFFSTLPRTLDWLDLIFLIRVVILVFVVFAKPLCRAASVSIISKVAAAWNFL